MADIVIGGRLHSAATGNTVAGANEIMDDAQGKKQSVVNQETNERFNAYDTAILGRYTNEEINNIISNTPETDVIVVDIPAASQSDIAGWLDANTPSGTDPETGRSVRANKLYRVPGPDNTTYSEWGWNGTAYIMLANKDYGIDDEPSPTSVNMVKAKGIYGASKYTKEIVITEDTPKSGWNPISKPISGLVYITANSPIMLSTTEDRGANVFIFKGCNTVDGVFVYLDKDYTYYTNTEAINNFKAVIKCVDVEDVFGGNVSPNVCQNWVKGYYLNNTFHPGSDDTYHGNEWQFGTINVEVGKYYLVPFCDSNGVQGIVNLDANGDFVSVNKQGTGDQTTGKVFNTFAIIQAVTPKIGITYYLNCWNFGSNSTPANLLRLPYLCLSDCLIQNPYNFGLSIFDKNPYKNVELLMNFEMTPILSGTPGYFNVFTQSLETDVVGNFKYSVIDVDAGEWYLINATAYTFLRIADFDGSHYSENTSAFQSYFDTHYGSRTSWILIKPKYNKLCISFVDPESQVDKISYQYPKYCKIERTNNNGLIPLFLQVMTNNISELKLDFNVVSQYSGGFYDKNYNRIETEVYGSWRYSIIDVEAGQWYYIETCLYENIRIADVDEQGNYNINASVPESLYTSDAKIRGVFVKPLYNKLCLSFSDVANRNDLANYYYPRYAKISEKENIFGNIVKLLDISKKDFIVRKSGGGDYTSLTKAIMDNFGKWNIVLHVDEGEYDLFEELEEYYGTSDFLSLTPKGRGIELGYDITIKASPKAIVKANYLGSDYNYKSRFSPFNCYTEANTGGFSLIGVNIQASMVRYCVHDDPGGNKLGTYNNLYENCNFYLDNRGNSWNATACIGGGLGLSGNIIIRHCIFEGLANNVPDANKNAVSYHNSGSLGAKSFISCVGNYISGDCGLRFSWYGDSQEITDIILEGNNVGHTTIVRAETTDGHSEIENISVKEWNTIVR